MSPALGSHRDASQHLKCNNYKEQHWLFGFLAKQLLFFLGLWALYGPCRALGPLSLGPGLNGQAQGADT